MVIPQCAPGACHSLNSNDVGAAGAAALGRMLKVNATLQELLCDPCAAMRQAASPTLPCNLTSLLLRRCVVCSCHGCALGDVGAAGLASGLGDNCKLQVLQCVPSEDV